MIFTQQLFAKSADIKEDEKAFIQKEQDLINAIETRDISSFDKADLLYNLSLFYHDELAVCLKKNNQITEAVECVRKAIDTAKYAKELYTKNKDKLPTQELIEAYQKSLSWFENLLQGNQAYSRAKFLKIKGKTALALTATGQAREHYAKCSSILPNEQKPVENSEETEELEHHLIKRNKTSHTLHNTVNKPYYLSNLLSAFTGVFTLPLETTKANGSGNSLVPLTTSAVLK